MERSRSCDAWRHPVRLPADAGVTLVEVLVAIMITGVGLLAMLSLFPLGALEMARAVKDDRTAEVAAQAQKLSATGEALIGRTLTFVQVSMATSTIDRAEAARLHDDYEQLARESVEMEIALVTLQATLPRAQIQRFVDPLLMQIRSIEWRLAQIAQLLSLLDSSALR